MVLLGHNGAGKSTLLSYLLGFYNQNNHHPFIKHFRQHIQAFSAKKIGYAPEAALLDFSLSAKEYFQLIASLQGVKTYDVTKVLAMVKLDVDPKMALKHYSKGMKQRLLIALALLGEPDIVILDEPTSGLDPFGQVVIEALILGLKQHYSFIICTHNLELAMQMDEDIWILQEGKIVYKGRPESTQALQTLFYSYLPKKLQ